MFTSQLSSHLSIDFDASKLERFVYRVQTMYPENPFHNFYHSCAVLQMAHHILYSTQRGQQLTPDLQLACLVAAFCHDIGHRGYTNGFENHLASGAAEHESARMEKMHVHLTVQLLWGEDDTAAILGKMPKQRQNEMRKQICEAIMGTDMKLHGVFVGDQALQRLCKEDAFFVQGVVKVSDLSSQTYGETQAQEWGRRITQEFNNQVLWEDAYGFEKCTVPYCATEVDFFKGQQFFVSKLAMPLWETFCKAAPEMEPRMKQLQVNNNVYSELARKTDSAALFKAAQRRSRQVDVQPCAVVPAPPPPPADLKKQTVVSAEEVAVVIKVPDAPLLLAKVASVLAVGLAVQVWLHSARM